jgi:hypothetical protein
MCSLELLMMDGKTSETCRGFYKNKYFEKRVHLVGFNIETFCVPTRTTLCKDKTLFSPTM